MIYGVQAAGGQGTIAIYSVRKGGIDARTGGGSTPLMYVPVKSLSWHACMLLVPADIPANGPNQHTNIRPGKFKHDMYIRTRSIVWSLNYPKWDEP